MTDPTPTPEPSAEAVALLNALYPIGPGDMQRAHIKNQTKIIDRHLAVIAERVRTRCADTCIAEGENHHMKAGDLDRGYIATQCCAAAIHTIPIADLMKEKDHE